MANKYISIEKLIELLRDCRTTVWSQGKYFDVSVVDYDALMKTLENERDGTNGRRS